MENKKLYPHKQRPINKHKTLHSEIKEQQGNQKRNKLDLERIPSVAQKGEQLRILFRRKNSREKAKTSQEETNYLKEKENDSHLKQYYLFPSSRVHQQYDSQLMDKRINSMMASINRIHKQQHKKLKTEFTPKHNLKRLHKLLPNWKEKSQVHRKYGNDRQQFQIHLRNKLIVQRINNAKPSNQLSLSHLDKSYRQHRIIVHLREQYQSLKKPKKQKSTK